MNGKIEANIQSIGDCLYTYHTIGTRNVKDICTDTLYQVPWGIFEWFSISMIIVMLFIFGLLALCSISS